MNISQAFKKLKQLERHMQHGDYFSDLNTDDLDRILVNLIAVDQKAGETLEETLQRLGNELSGELGESAEAIANELLEALANVEAIEKNRKQTGPTAHSGENNVNYSHQVSCANGLVE
jgi:hypothetical protein